MTFRAKRGLEDFGWGDWDRTRAFVVPSDVTIVEGTKRKDFIHAVDDGLVAPKGYNDMAVLTDQPEFVHGGEGSDIIITMNADHVYGGGGADILYGQQFYVDDLEDISGFSEEMHHPNDGYPSALWLQANGGMCDLTSCIIEDVGYLNVISTDSTPINVLLTLDQLSHFTSIGGGTGPTATFHITDAGTLHLGTETVYNCNLYGTELADEWTFNQDILASFDKSTIYMGGGDDVIRIPQAQLLTVSGGEGDDRIIVHGPDLHYSGNSLSGDVGNDYIEAGRRSDWIYGGEGNDILNGGGGADRLFGDVGADVFLYEGVQDSGTPKKRSDTIADFSQTDGDKIDLSAIDADKNIAGDQAFHLAGHAFTHTAGEIIQVKHGATATELQMDVNGDGRADMAILLDTTVTLVATDFIL